MNDMGLHGKEPSVSHVSEEMAERYVMRKLSESEEQAVEEHLLVCPACLDLIENTEQFVAVTREALRRQSYAAPQESKRVSRKPWKLIVPAFGTAALAAGLLIQFSAGPLTSSPVEVSLTAFRSAESSTAPSGRNLILSLQTAGLPDSVSQRYRVVRATGEPVAEGQASITGGKAAVRLSRPLAAGNYWVHLYSGDGALLREYGLTVK